MVCRLRQVRACRNDPDGVLPGVGFWSATARPRENLIEFLDGVVAELQIEHSRIFVELFDRSRSNDWARDRRLRQKPRQGDVRRLLPNLGAMSLEFFEFVAVFVDVFLGKITRPPAFVHFLQCAAQNATLERTPRNEAESIRLARRNDFQLNGPVDEIVQALLAHEAHEVPRLGNFIRLRNMKTSEVGRTHVGDFPLGYERFHSLPHFLPWGVSVDVVHLVQLDMVGLHAFERRFTRAPNVHSRKASFIGPITHGSVDFRRNDCFFATPATLGKPSPNDVFRDALALFPAIDVGRVEEVDSEFECPIHDTKRILFGRMRTKVHGSEAQTTDFEGGAAETSVLHGAARYTTDYTVSTTSKEGKLLGGADDVVKIAIAHQA